MRLSASSQISISEKSIFGHFEFVFPKVQIFLKSGWIFPASKFKQEFFNEKMTSLAGLKKVIQFPAEEPILAICDYLGPPSKSIFSTYRQKIGNLWNFC